MRSLPAFSDAYLSPEWLGPVACMSDGRDLRLVLIGDARDPEPMIPKLSVGYADGALVLQLAVRAPTSTGSPEYARATIVTNW